MCVIKMCKAPFEEFEMTGDKYWTGEILIKLSISLVIEGWVVCMMISNAQLLFFHLCERV